MTTQSENLDSDVFFRKENQRFISIIGYQKGGETLGIDRQI